MFKNLKLGVKLIGGFIIVALIVLLVGFFGWTGSRQLQDHIHEIGDVRLPSIESLLEVEIELEELMTAQRTLLSELLDSDQRAQYFQNFNDSRDAYAEAWAYFKTLPATAEEERLSSQFETAVEEWRVLNNEWIEMNRNFEAIDVLDPASLVAELQRFRGDHYELELKVAMLLLADQNFSGGDDPTACNFGRWLPTVTTENQELLKILDDIRVPHNRFHEAVGRIHELVDAGDTGAALNHFRSVMLPASEQVFVYFDQMIDFADRAEALRDEITTKVLGPITDEARQAMSILDKLIHINETIAEEAVFTADADGTRVELIALIGMIAGVVAALILGIILTRGITAPIAKGVSFAQEIADGNLDIKLDVEQKDEVGQLADSLRFMLGALQYKEQVVKTIAEKDLTIKVEPASDKDNLGHALVSMVDSLNDILKQVNFAVDQVASGSDQVSQASQNLSQGATEQASSLEEISSSLSEVNGQSQQNANNATEATGLAKKAAEDAVNGNGQMKELTGAMQKINDSSDEISKVVKVIDDIAFQINLLALNANVEAARAGKYGKGFAVVAEEVRNLAVRAADAVKETTGMVEVAISNIQSGNGLVGQTAEQLEEIVSGANKVAEFLDEIATASREQAEAVEQVNSGLDQIDQVTQSNTASAEESASAAEELAGQSQQLKSMIATFKLEADSRGAYALEYKPQTVQQGGRQQYQQQGQAQPRQTQPQGQQQPRQPGQTQHQKPRADQSKRGDETGIKPLDPSEVIQLDDDDFENF